VIHRLNVCGESLIVFVFLVLNNFMTSLSDYFCVIMGRQTSRELYCEPHSLVIECKQGGPKEWHKVYGTIILQPYITESCGF